MGWIPVMKGLPLPPSSRMITSRTLLLTTVLAAFGGGLAAAENRSLRANVGVGIGTLLFEAAGSDGLFSQTCAATTNGLFANQTFFITTGTGGATHWSEVVQNQPLREFVRDNLDSLARDAAAGRGESLDALAELAGVHLVDRPLFRSRVQAGFAQIFTSSEVTSDEVVANLGRVLG
jgi:hypothetical protein